MTKWDARFIQLARTVAGWSKDPSTKVGAVVVRPDNTVASLGFNGFPRGVEDSGERLNDRPLKHLLTVHAEANAILAAKEPLHGCTIYVAELHPCAQCAAQIIQSGIVRVVAVSTDNPRWTESFDAASLMLTEAGVKVDMVSGNY